VLLPKTQEAQEFAFGFEKFIEKSEEFKKILVPFRTFVFLS
jgi:hypothetical protein